ncbi:MAG: SpvB/TcaC N-terminal domain-containing protein, partial [Pseudomonadota bacterium]
MSIAEMALPNGGSQTGFGETFQANPFTGALSFIVPIPITPTNRRSQPELQITYSTGNGVFGRGFGLTLPSVSRRTDKGIPRYDQSDQFVLAGSEQLVLQQELIGEEWRPVRSVIEIDDTEFEVTRYRPRIENSPSKIEFWVNKQNKSDCHWRVTNRAGVTSCFGSNEHSRITDPDDPNRIFEWLIDIESAPDGSCTRYHYRSDSISGSANRYPDRISYGNLRPDKCDAFEDFAFEVIFDYGERDINQTKASLDSVHETPLRPDPILNFRAGFERTTSFLCKNILMVHRFPDELGKDASLVSAISFDYETESCGAVLSTIRHCGFVQEGEHYRRKSLPPLDITYSKFAPQANQLTEFDLKGSGIAAQIGPDSCNLVDVFGDGLPGILLTNGDALMYARPCGDGCFETSKALPLVPIDYLHEDNRCAMMDISGTGRLDVVVATPSRAGF